MSGAAMTEKPLIVGAGFGSINIPLKVPGGLVIPETTLDRAEPPVTADEIRAMFKPPKRKNFKGLR